MTKLIPKNGNDKVYTPEDLCERIVKYFKPSGRVLEPCKGTGNFMKYLPNNTEWCEIDEGVDFFDYDKLGVDWIITNPPYSIIKKFLIKSYMLDTKHIVYVVPINHILGLKARLNDMKKYGYAVRELILINTPKEFPQSGFQYSIVHIEKGKQKGIKITDWR
jgi:DNA modification methylase